VTIGIVPMTSAISPTFTPRAAAKYKGPNCSASDSAPTTALCRAARPRGQATPPSPASAPKISPAAPKRRTRSVKGAL
jgi:hypothetical protein